MPVAYMPYLDALKADAEKCQFIFEVGFSNIDTRLRRFSSSSFLLRILECGVYGEHVSIWE